MKAGRKIEKGGMNVESNQATFRIFRVFRILGLVAFFPILVLFFFRKNPATNRNGKSERLELDVDMSACVGEWREEGRKILEDR